MSKEHTATPHLPDMITWQEIGERLELIFPEGIPNRGYITRDTGAKTVFVMLYVGAIDGNDIWVRPDQVTRMSDAQASATDVETRLAWTEFSVQAATPIEGRWYAVNTRESIRDETIRQGLVEYGAVIERPLPTTSSLGRYALKESFADLFHPDLHGQALLDTVEEWRSENLSPSALARVRLMRQSIVETGKGVVVTFPNGETRRLAPGPSSAIVKALVEDFVPRFLDEPGILWISESARKEDRRDTALMADLGLEIDTDRLLPDVLLVDLGPDDPLFVFVEVVATDGPVTESRHDALLAIITDAGYSPSQAAFVTAYLDRDHAAFKRTIGTVAWNTFAWCVSEPNRLIAMIGATDGRALSAIIQQMLGTR